MRNNGNRFVSDYIEDAMATSLLEGTNVDYQRSRQVIVFYNGIYHGIYDMREKLNEHFVETNYGIDDKSVDFVKHSSRNIKTQNGSNADYLAMLQYVYNNDFANNNVTYDSIKKIIEIPNYIEYMAAEIYYHNGDWPHNNVRAWKAHNAPWRFIAFDIDHDFDWTWNVSGFSKNTNMLNWILEGGKTTGVCHTNNNYSCFHNIFERLIKNTSFRQKFINRAAYLYSSFINSNKVQESVVKINKTLDNQQIYRDMQMYNRPSYHNLCGSGFTPLAECIVSWSKQRDKTARNDLRETFDLGEDVPINIQIIGNGRIKLDNETIVPNSSYSWTVFEKHPMQLSIECYAGTTFKSWENGLTNPNRIIYPQKKCDFFCKMQLNRLKQLS